MVIAVSEPVRQINQAQLGIGRSLPVSTLIYWLNKRTCFQVFKALLNHNTQIGMGKGDKKSRRGKISQGSFGNSRPGKTGKSAMNTAPEAKPQA